MTDHTLRPDCAKFQGEMEARMVSAEKRVKVIEDHGWTMILAVLGILANIIISLFNIKI